MNSCGRPWLAAFYFKSMTLKNSILFSFLLLLGFAMIGCEKKNDGDDVEVNFDKSAMLKNIGENIIIPAYADLKECVDSLEYFGNEFTSNPNKITLVALQKAHKKAYLSFQSVAVFEFGPADAQLLRASFNTFPCDTAQILSKISAGDYSISTVADLDAKGFPAIDYLIYGSEFNNDSIVAKFTTASNASNRRTYLTTLINSLKTKTDAVNTAWSVSGGNYLATFISSTGTDVGSSIGLLVNAINSYYERDLRDGKLGIPVGIRSAGVSLPSQTEAFYGKFSAELLQASLVSIKALYTGTYGSTNALGFDDYLVAYEGNAIDENIRNYLADAIIAANTLTDPLSQQIINNQASVEAVYSKLQKVIIPLKVDMPSKLGVLISYQDNDGD